MRRSKLLAESMSRPTSSWLSTTESSDVVWPQLIGRPVEKRRELPDCQQVRSYGSLRVITTLEFLQHLFSKLGHRDLLVTHKILLPSRDRYPNHHA